MATLRNAFALLQEERKILRQKEKKERALQRKAEKQARLLREEKKTDVDQDHVSNEAAEVKEQGAANTQREAGTPTSSIQSPLREEQKMNWADVTDDDELDSVSVQNDVEELDRGLAQNNVRPGESVKNAVEDEDDGLAEFYSEDDEDEEDEDDEDDEDQPHHKDHNGFRNGNHVVLHGKRGSLRPGRHSNTTQAETLRSPAAPRKSHRSAKASAGPHSEDRHTSSAQESVTQSSASLSHPEAPAAVSGGALSSPFSSSYSSKQLSKKDRQKLQEQELEALDALLDSFGLKNNASRPDEEGAVSTNAIDAVGVQCKEGCSSTTNAVKSQDPSARAEDGTSEEAPPKVPKNKKRKKTTSTTAQGALPTGTTEGPISEKTEHGERTTTESEKHTRALSPKAAAAAARRAAAASGSKKKSKPTGGIPVPDAVLAEAKIKSELKKAKQKKDKHMFDR